MLAGPSLPQPSLFQGPPQENQIPYNFWALTEAYQHGVYHSSEKYIQKRSQHTSLTQPLKDVKLLRVLTIIRAHASTHAFVELVKNGYHILWCTETCEHNP